MEDVTITSEKLVDRITTILNELEVLKKALMEKTMNKEKTNLLAKWILDEKTKQIKDETLDLEYELVDEVQIDVSNSGSSPNSEYFEPYTKGEKEKKESLNIGKGKECYTIP